MLPAVGHYALGDGEFSVLAEFCDSFANGGINALYLNCFHLAEAVVVHVDFRCGIEHASTRPLALAVVLFDIFDMGVFAYKEAVDTVVAALHAAGIVYAAARDYGNGRAFAYIKIIIYLVVHSRFGEKDGDVHRFAG